MIERPNPSCIVCDETMLASRPDPWCLMCSIKLREMSWDGEEILRLVHELLPPILPSPPGQVAAVPIPALWVNGMYVLQRKGILPNPKGKNSDGNAR